MCIKRLWTRFKQGLYLQKKYIPIRLLPFTFAHISDLHFDSTGKLPAWVRRSVEDYLYANPTELLCVTGDLVDKSDEWARTSLEWLNALPVNYVIISLGNHDRDAQDAIFKISSEYPKLKVYINDTFVYQSVNFICLPDKSDKYYKIGVERMKEMYAPFQLNFVLSHNPNSFLDLYNITDITGLHILGGHTHGGQVGHADFLRNLFKRFINERKVLCALKINHEHDCFQLQGTCNKSGNYLFINNGLGTHPPGRIFCPPQITIYN